eukprot:scaffold2514_cov373-Prasinococcus_capsulatus_cf.AAC.4
MGRLLFPLLLARELRLCRILRLAIGGLPLTTPASLALGGFPLRLRHGAVFRATTSSTAARRSYSA